MGDVEWKLLTFSDLRPGDTVKLDEEGPEETVRMVNGGDVHGVLFRTHLYVRYGDRVDPVLVRFPRPEEEA